MQAGVCWPRICAVIDQRYLLHDFKLAALEQIIVLEQKMKQAKAVLRMAASWLC